MWDDTNDDFGRMHDGAGAWLGMGLMMLVVTIVVVGLLLWVALMLRGHTRAVPLAPGARALSAAEEHLAERFARGEIDGEDFEARSEALRKARRSVG